MITRTQLNYIRENKLIPTPVDPKTKRPIAVFQGVYDKKGKPKKQWKFDWTDEDILSADAVGVYHKDKDKNPICAAVDFDDLAYVAHDWNNMLPPSMSVAKQTKLGAKVNQRIYKVNGSGFPNLDYGGNSKDDGKLVETLQSGVSVIHSPDRTFTMVPLAQANNEELLKRLKLICFFTEVQKNFVGEGQRDTTHLALQGALARLDEKEYPTTLLEGFIEQLCINVGDDEYSNRINKLSYQREQLAKGVEEVKGIPALCKALGVENLLSYDLLKNNVEEKDYKDYPLLTDADKAEIVYPPTKWIMENWLMERSFNQVFGDSGSGKTILCLKLAYCIANGYPFLDMKCITSMPVLYIEGELPGTQLEERKNTIKQYYYDKGKSLNNDWLISLNKDDLRMHGFKFGFDPIAVHRNMSKEDAKDYGRRGRELINRLQDKILKKTGRQCFTFLDNITALADIDENVATDWKPITQWGTNRKNDGFASCFLHHSNKQENGRGSSGSSAINRLLDFSLQLKKLDQEYRFTMPGTKSVQCSVHYDKERHFLGQPFMLTCCENGVWTEYPFLKQISFKILELAKQGLRQVQIRAMAKELKCSEATVDRLHKQLRNLGLIKDEKPNL